MYGKNAIEHAPHFNPVFPEPQAVSILPDALLRLYMEPPYCVLVEAMPRENPVPNATLSSPSNAAIIKSVFEVTRVPPSVGVEVWLLFSAEVSTGDVVTTPENS